MEIDLFTARGLTPSAAPSAQRNICPVLRSRKVMCLRSAGLREISKVRRGRLCKISAAFETAENFSKSLQHDTLRHMNTTSGSHTVNITVHGVESEDDLERLEVNLRTLNIVDLWLGPLKQGGPRRGFVSVQLEVEDGFPLAILTKEIQALDSKFLVLPYTTKSWMWRGHKINFAVAGCGKPLILVHGFGGNAGHFSRLISSLADSYKVYAVDLLGFGDSEKPKGADYSPDLWAELITDFTREFAKEGAVLIGNSIGSLTALTASAKSGKDVVRGLVLLNCAGAMNRKGLTEDGWLLKAVAPAFAGVEWLLQRPRIANFLFNRFRSKENIKKILTEQAYKSKAAVTDQLVDLLYHPSTDEGAVDVFVKVFTSDNPGTRPEKLMSAVEIPVLVLWGDSDPWTPVNGPVAKYFVRLASERSNVQVYALKDVGHCPHDDRHEIAAEYIVNFLSSCIGW